MSWSNNADLGGLQRLVDAGLPTRAGCLELVDDVLVEPNVYRLLRPIEPGASAEAFPQRGSHLRQRLGKGHRMSQLFVGRFGRIGIACDLALDSSLFLISES